MAHRPSAPSARRRAPGAAPGAGPPGAARTFLHGDFAAATVDGVTWNMFDWRVQVRTTVLNTRAHGQRWAQRTPIESEWVFTASGYMTTNAVNVALAAGFVNESADPPLLTVIGYSGDNATAPVFTGTGYMTSCTVSAPDQGMAVHEFEITGHATPSAGLS